MVKVVELPESVMYKGDRDLSTVSIGEFTRDRELDRKVVRQILIDRGIKNLDKYVIHHDYKNGVFQLIDRDIHKEFSHYGGYYFYK